MGDKSAIQWTDATWNPTSGCTRASPGCDNCYAVTMTRRLAAMGQAKYAGLVNEGKRHFNGTVRTDEYALPMPLGWRKPRQIFVDSMSDLFHPAVQFEFIDRVLAVAALTPRHTYQLLTKRAERAAEYFGQLTPERLIDVVAEDYGDDAWSFAGNWIDGWSMPKEVPNDGNPLNGTVKRWPLPNVWMGTTVEDQERADERIPHLLRVPAAVRFLSCEPLLGPLDLTGWFLIPVADRDSFVAPLDWVIVGGESGPGARPFDLSWARRIVQQCKAADVPVFVKQLGAHPVEPIPGKEETRAVNQPFMGGGWSHLGLRNKKGGDMDEWPADLQVREMPA
jgi:protein gp37